MLTLKPDKLLQSFKRFISLIMPAKQSVRKTAVDAPASKKPAKKVAPTAKRKPASSAPAPQVATPAEPTLVAPEAAKPFVQGAKVVRDGFTMPQADFDLLKSLKAQCLKAGVEVKKSELLRAGIQALAALPMGELAARLKTLPQVKAGRRKSKV